ncbi:unnamed protein product, partial [Prunus brigantina]
SLSTLKRLLKTLSLSLSLSLSHTHTHTHFHLAVSSPNSSEFFILNRSTRKNVRNLHRRSCLGNLWAYICFGQGCFGQKVIWR